MSKVINFPFEKVKRCPTRPPFSPKAQVLYRLLEQTRAFKAFVAFKQSRGQWPNPRLFRIQVRNLFGTNPTAEDFQIMEEVYDRARVLGLEIPFERYRKQSSRRRK